MRIWTDVQMTRRLTSVILTDDNDKPIAYHRNLAEALDDAINRGADNITLIPYEWNAAINVPLTADQITGTIEATLSAIHARKAAQRG